MSTRGHIAIKENGKYTYIFNHHDSYLAGVGITLYQHYKDVDKVKQLISLGDLSSVGATIEEGGSTTYDEHFNNPIEKRGTIAYFREGNRWKDFSPEDWDDVKPRETEKMNEVLGQDYTYIFDVEQNCWFVGFWNDDYKLYKLEELLHSKELLQNIFADCYITDYQETFYDKCLKA